MEPDKAEKVEGKYLQPLVESRCLKPISTDKPSQKQVPLIWWMKDIQAHLVTNGMDRVFYSVDTKNNVVVNLLESWSKTTVAEVAEWVKTKPWDFHDYDNLQMSGKFLQDSISDKLYERIKFARDESGPLMCVSIVQEMQHCSCKTHC